VRSAVVGDNNGKFSADGMKRSTRRQPQLALVAVPLGLTLGTEIGVDLLDHVRAMGEAAGLVSLGASGRAQAIVGLVRISAGEAVSAYLLPPIVERIREEYPEIHVHLVVSNRLSDLLRREADIAIRHVRPEQPDLVAKKVRDTSAHLYAAKRWVQLHGRPKTAADLADAAFIGGDDNARFVEMLTGLGLSVTLENFKSTTDSHAVAWELVKQGLGIGAMIKEVAQVTPEVEPIVPELPPIVVPYWLCTHRELHTSRRIRLVFDLLAEALAKPQPVDDRIQ
jgi:DNA-binding transcriptional LysR family regulator